MKITIELEVPDTSSKYDIERIKTCTERLVSPDWIYQFWSTEDVRAVAENMDIEMSDEVAREILHEVDHHHDANIGINWSVIESYVERYSDEEITE